MTQIPPAELTVVKDSDEVKALKAENERLQVDNDRLRAIISEMTFGEQCR